ncbi:hypothetical protein [Streptomyces sp. TP-A0356]|uniref:hypothetical protein n=1 Tax=Streptomyces sp. TP-A0356 TaxID=1359208 RepID=UPI0006E34B78|nr:hypothetical protein [Streptomyces sp. TP-A0356]
MRVLRVVSVALLGCTALACTAPTSVTGGDHETKRTAFDYDVRPTTIGPGERITLPVRGCNDNATVFSGAFDTVTIPKGHGAAEATIARDARPGTNYDVTFQCGHDFGHRNLAIAAARENGNGNGGYGNGNGGYGNGNGNGGYGNRNGGYGNGNGNGGYGNGNGNGRNDGEERDSERSDFERHGVHAGVGGSIGGFDPKQIGLGVVLIAGTLGAAWHMSRRRTADGRS